MTETAAIAEQRPNREWVVVGWPQNLTFRTRDIAEAAAAVDLATAWAMHYQQFGHGIDLIIHAKILNDQPLSPQEEGYLLAAKSEPAALYGRIRQLEGDVRYWQQIAQRTDLVGAVRSLREKQIEFANCFDNRSERRQALQAACEEVDRLIGVDYDGWFASEVLACSAAPGESCACPGRGV